MQCAEKEEEENEKIEIAPSKPDFSQTKMPIYSQFNAKLNMYTHTQYPQQLPIPHNFHRVFTSCLQSRSGKQIVSGRLEVLALICCLQTALYFTFTVHRWMARLNVAFAPLYVSKSSGSSKNEKKRKTRANKNKQTKKTSAPQMEPCTNAFESLINLPENLCFDYKESGSLLHASFCFCFLFLLIIHAVICLFRFISDFQFKVICVQLLFQQQQKVSSTRHSCGVAKM